MHLGMREEKPYIKVIEILEEVLATLMLKSSSLKKGKIFLYKFCFSDLVITAQHLQRLEISFVIEIHSEKLGALLPEFAYVGE